MKLATAPEKRVVIYARVSTDDSDQATSIPNQLERCRRHADLMEWHVIAELKDEGVSGRTMERAGWIEATRLIESKEADIILSTNLTRMSRNLEGFLNWIRTRMAPSGGAIAAISDQLDTSSAMGRMALQMMLMFAEWQVEHTREQTIAGMRAMLQRGLYRGRQPFGTLPGAQKGIPLKDEKTWPYVEQIFAWRLAGLTYIEIATALNSMDVLPLKGGRWSTSSVATILGNTFYAGYSEADENGEKVRYPLQHDCTVSMATFEAVQRVKRNKPGPAPSLHPMVCRNLLVTSHGSVTFPPARSGEPVRLVSKPCHGRRKPYPYYVVETKRGNGTGVQALAVDDSFDSLPYLPAELIESAVLDALELMAMNDSTGLFLVDYSRYESKAQDYIDGELQERRKRLKRLERQREAEGRNALKMLTEGDHELKNALERQLGEYSAQIAALEAEIARIEVAQAQFEGQREALSETAKQINMIAALRSGAHWDDLRIVLETLIDRIDVRLDGVRIYWKHLPEFRFEVANAGTHADSTQMVRRIGSKPPLPRIEPGSAA